MDLVKNIEYDITYADEYENTAEPEIEKNMASKNHAKIQSRLAKELGVSYDDRFDIYTEFEIELLGKRVVPDVSVYPLEPSNWKKDIIRGDESPVLAIEILSPKQSYDEVVLKIRETYLPAGVRSAWFVLPSTEMVMIFTPDDVVKTFSSGILKDDVSGFEVDLNKIFR
jgi:Uma2 family endonuclease